MKLCNDTVTVYNARLDKERDSTVYIPTVIHDVSWYKTSKATVDSGGLKAASQCIVRIPLEADAGGKSYTEPWVYKSAGDVSGLFTLNEGDFIIKGAFSDTLFFPPAPGSGFVTILTVTDNRRAPNAPHWKVTGA